jgi:hypothetical protein
LRRRRSFRNVRGRTSGLPCNKCESRAPATRHGRNDSGRVLRVTGRLWGARYPSRPGHEKCTSESPTSPWGHLGRSRWTAAAGAEGPSGGSGWCGGAVDVSHFVLCGEGQKAVVGTEKAPLQSIDFVEYSGCVTCGTDLRYPLGLSNLRGLSLGEDVGCGAEWRVESWLELKDARCRQLTCSDNQRKVSIVRRIARGPLCPFTAWDFSQIRGLDRP